MRNRLLILFLFAALFAPMASQAQQTITLKADSIAVPCHDVDTFLIPIRVFDFNSVAGLQYTFEWNPVNLDYAYITNVNPAFSGIGFDTTTFQTQGKFTFSWTAIGGLSLPDSAVLLQVAFTRLGGPASLVGFSNSPTAIAAIDPLGNDLTVVTAPGLVSPIDTEAPTVVCPGNVTQEVFGPTPVNSIAPASILDNCSIQSIGWSTVGATTGNSPNDPDASGATFNLGQSSVTYLVTDVGGNTASCSFQINLTLAPSDSLTLIASNGAGSCGETITINISVLNYDSIAGIQFSLGWDPAVLSFDTIANAHPSLVLDASNFGTQQMANGFISFAWTSGLPFGLSLVNGSVLFSLTFNVVATGNSSSNIAFGNFPTDMLAISSATNPSQEIGFLIVNGTVVITDTAPPAIQCPANVSVATPPGVITATFNNLDPLSLTDNCSANVGLAYQQTGATTGSGLGSANGTYNAGTTVVTYTATDGSGNTSTCSFSVLVDAGTPLTLILDTVAVDCQDSAAHIAVNLTVRDFVNIIGLQFDIQWDSSIIKFDSVGNLYPGLGLNPTTFFGFTSALTGNTLKFFGGNAGGWPAIPDNDTLFTMYFTVDNLGSSNIDFTGIISAVNSAFNVVPMILVNGYFNITDLTPPNLVCPMDVVIPADSAACVATYLLAPAQATDVCSGIMSVVSNKTDNIYPTGPTVVIFTATDDAGNSATCSMTVTVQGDALPQLTNCPPNVTVGVTTAVCSAAVSWNLPQAFNPCDGMNLNVEASDTSGTVFPLGDSVVTFLAFNISGDTVMCSFTVSVRDSLPPMFLNCQNPPPVQADSTCSVIVMIDPLIAGDNCSQNIVPIGDTDLSIPLPVGDTVVTYTATDASGNSSTCSLTITVFDGQSPVFNNCPSDVTVYSAADSCGVSVFWDPLTATDDCTANLSIDSTNYSGEFFPVDTNSVEYSVSDGFTPQGTCVFVVTVLDTLAPVLNCPMNLIVFLPADKCDTLVTWAEPTPTDGCGIDDLVASHDNMTTVFPTGVHVVTYTAYDPSGNSAECTFTIEVKDVVDPVLAACPADTVLVDANPCGVSLIWALPDATDNCQLDTVYSIPASGTLLSNNITTVVVYALDASGNDDTCSFTITLQFPNIPPGFDSFPADVTLNGCAQPVSWTIPVPNSVFCSTPTIEVIPSTAMPGDTFPVGVTNIIYVALDSITGLEVVRDTFTVTVVDDAPPVLSGCPTAPVIVHIGGLIVSDSSGFVTALDTIADCSGVEVTFNLPTATDSCGGALVAQTTGPLSGMVFPGDSVSTLVFVATDDNGNTSECSVNVAVVGLQPVGLTIDPPVACHLPIPGDMVILTADQLPGAVYTWMGPNPDIQNQNTSQVTIFASPGNVGTYSVTASLNGCTTPPASVDLMLYSVTAIPDTIIISMDGSGLDTFSVVANDLIFPAGDFTVDTCNGTSWPEGITHLGNGIFTYDANERFRQFKFLYCICSESCPDECDEGIQVIVRLEVTDCSFIPNIITPNGDEQNDKFIIPCLDSDQYRDNSIVIYNQWGDKVFGAAPYDNTWTGTLNNEAGKDLPDGVYYYIFKSSPGEPARKGFVQIHR